jgi:hypothetical protein
MKFIYLPNIYRQDHECMKLHCDLDYVENHTNLDFGSV